MRTQRLVLAPIVAGLLAATSNAQQCCTGNVSTYCTAGTSVQGCLPQISGVGVPSADAVSGFQITVSGVPAQRYGTIFYGFYAASQPWAPFSPSFLCVAPPVQRTGNIASGGAPASCTGQLALEFNAWRAMNPTALGSPFLAGQTIRAQGWYRDPAAPGQTNLSDALVFNLCNGVGDTTPPVITTCAANQTVGATVGCEGIVPDFTTGVIASDNCTPVTMTQSPAAGVTAPLGVTLVTITVRDAPGNASQCVATLTVTDMTAPVITVCAPSQSVSANGNCQAIVPDFTAAVVAAETCSPPVVVTQLPPAGAVAEFGRALVTISAQDAAGNISSCVADFLVLPSSQCTSLPGYVPIYPGVFQMGQGGVAIPAHQVTITYPFWMKSTEVTQSDYLVLMGSNPSLNVSMDRPVEQVNWDMARAYCNALTVQQAAFLPVGYEYRLPTEAEWEYACRAGTTSLWSVGSAVTCGMFNYGFCVGGSTVVGTFPRMRGGSTICMAMSGSGALTVMRTTAPLLRLTHLLPGLASVFFEVAHS